MPPDFGRNVVEALAKRAGLICSNIDCRAGTCGPSDDSAVAINIGEAAHIYGATPTGARFRDTMTDSARAEITNGIWLCRNCHKLVDSDPKRFPAELLFQWREFHEQYITSKLGTRTDLLRLEIERQEVEKFKQDSALAKQIVRDKPDGWEYRLTAELLKDYLRDTIRAWNDLQRGLYSRPTITVASEDAGPWFSAKSDEVCRLARTVKALYSEELPRAWGKLGEPGNASEIKHVCKLVRSVYDQILNWEESVRFVSVEVPFTQICNLLPGALGRQLDRLESVPRMLDEVVDWSEDHPGEQGHFHFKFSLDLPDEWLEQIETELKELGARAGYSR